MIKESNTYSAEWGFFKSSHTKKERQDPSPVRRSLASWQSVRQTIAVINTLVSLQLAFTLGWRMTVFKMSTRRGKSSGPPWRYLTFCSTREAVDRRFTCTHCHFTGQRGKIKRWFLCSEGCRGNQTGDVCWSWFLVAETYWHTMIQRRLTLQKKRRRCEDTSGLTEVTGIWNLYVEPLRPDARYICELADDADVMLMRGGKGSAISPFLDRQILAGYWWEVEVEV